MGALSGNFLLDAFDKSDRFGVKTTLDSATVSQETTIRKESDCLQWEGGKEWMWGLLQKDQGTVAKGRGERAGEANVELLDLEGWLYKWCL